MRTIAAALALTPFALTAVALTAAPVAAQQAAPAITIHAGRLIAIPGKPPRGSSTIVVRGERIVAVSDGHQPPGDGGPVVDLKDRTVLPGLIDSHVHLGSDRAGQEGLLAEFTESDPLRAYEALWNARKTLLAGFTTVRNLGDDGAVLALRDAIARGWVEGPRIVDAGRSISTTSGHMDGRLGIADELRDTIAHDNLCDGPEACRRAVRLQIGRGADVIKIATTGGVNSRIGAGLGAQMFDDEARAVVETAHLYGKKVAVHAHGADGIALALRSGADSIEHGTLLTDAEIALFRKTGAYYVPTLSTVNGYLERIAKDPNAYPPAVRAKIDWRISITGQALAKAVPAGVKIAFGTDAGVSKHGRNADEFGLMVKHGMTPTGALQAATVNAADLLGLGKEIGTIEVGKAADIIAVTGDPLADVGGADGGGVRDEGRTGGEGIARVPLADDEAAIRLIRVLWNAAIAARDATGAAAPMTDDAVLIPAGGAPIVGRAAIERAWRKGFVAPQPVQYVRTPITIDFADDGGGAAESGAWVGHVPGEDGEARLSGRYLAEWRMVGGEWRCAAELYVGL